MKSQEFKEVNRNTTGIKACFQGKQGKRKTLCLSSGKRKKQVDSNLLHTVILRHFLCTWWFNTKYYSSCSTHLGKD